MAFRAGQPPAEELREALMGPAIEVDESAAVEMVGEIRSGGSVHGGIVGRIRSTRPCVGYDAGMTEDESLEGRSGAMLRHVNETVSERALRQQT
jgi:hypothetical protein